MLRSLLWMGLLPLMCGAAPNPADWVPARWPWTDEKSLELLANSPVNCVLVRKYDPAFLAAANARGLVTQAIVQPGGDVVAAAKEALSAKATGIVLEGEFSAEAVAKVREAAGEAPVIELTARNQMRLDSKAPIVGTNQ